MKHGKKYQEAVKKYDKAKVYTISEAAGLVKELSFAKHQITNRITQSLHRWLM